MKEPLGGIPPLGSLRVGSLSILAEMAKIEIYRHRIWGFKILPKLCALFTKRMGYLIKFSPDRFVVYPVSVSLLCVNLFTQCQFSWIRAFVVHPNQKL